MKLKLAVAVTDFHGNEIVINGQKVMLNDAIVGALLGMSVANPLPVYDLAKKVATSSEEIEISYSEEEMLLATLPLMKVLFSGALKIIINNAKSEE